MTKMEKAPTAEPAAPAFAKDQLLASERYARYRDMLNALLDSGRTYTAAEVDAHIEGFKKGKVI